jgi:TonB family protein
MFDNLVAAHGPSTRSRAKNIVITTSVIAHAVAIAALAIAAMWRIDKLEFNTPGTRLNGFTLPHDSGGGERPKSKPLVAKIEEVKKVVPTVVVQPRKEIVKEPPRVADDDEGAQGTGDTLATGNGTGGDGKGLKAPTGPACTTDKCDGDGLGGEVKEKKKIVCLKGEKLIDGVCVKDKKIETLTPDVARGLRKSGNERIPAPQSVRVSMMRANESRLVGTIKLCLDTRGHVDRVQVLKSTGYDKYDDVLVDEIRDWRYEPYKVEGEPVPACTVVTIVYVMQ